MQGDLILLFLVLWPMVMAFVGYILGRYNKKARDFAADGAVILEFVIAAWLFTGGERNFTWEGFCGMGMNLTLDGFRSLYGLIAALMWMMTTIFSREYFSHYRNRNRYYLFMLMTLGATMGVFLSADLYTTFIFFEIMSFTSFVWVAHEEKPAAMKAAITYLAVAVIGGMVMLMGIFLLYDAIGTLTMAEILPQVKALLAAAPREKTRLYIAGALMVFGFGAKAGMFPLHIWLPKAHPVAPAPSSALLSGILTKSGVFGILVVSSNIFLHDAPWGIGILCLGVLTMFGGAMLAVFSVDFKRTLACSSMSQIGFILVGVGMQGILGEENALAVRGTLLHMVNHSLIKLVLFMVAGVIYMNIHKLNLNDIRGFGRKKPLLMFSYLMGALGIGGIPLWNGYVSKTLLHESIVEAGHLYHEGLVAAGYTFGGTFWTAVEWIFLLSGGMTVAYMLKLFVAVFLERNEDEKVQAKYDGMTSYWKPESIFAIVPSAVLLWILGAFPKLTMDKLADLGQEFMHGEMPEHAIHYFSLENLKGAAISIAVGAILYFGVIRTWMMVKDKETGIRRYVDRWPAWLDLEDRVYRPILISVLTGICGAGCSFFDKYIIDVPVKTFIFLTSIVSRFLDHLVDNIIVMFRTTTHRQHETTIHINQQDEAAIHLGSFIDRVSHDKQNSHIPALMEKEEHLIRTNRIVAGSLSYGLMLASLGLIAVLLYLLFWLL